jgi:NAD+ diphosphatase
VPQLLTVLQSAVAVTGDDPPRLRLTEGDGPIALSRPGVVTRAIDHEADPAAPPPGPFAELRDLDGTLPPADAALAAEAIALTTWHATHSHCARCGHRTEVAAHGRRRRCPTCGASHHPRTDPCVIVLVTRGDAALLVRRPGAVPGRHTCVAGFVDPGESAEDAVAREVREEVGLGLVPGSVTYVASQPWPGPHSLMLGFTATAADGDVVLQRDELEAARWVTRGALRDGLATGELVTPPPLSMAHRLVVDCFLQAPPSATAG